MSVLATNNIRADDRIDTLSHQGGGAGHTPPGVGRGGGHKSNKSSGEDLSDHGEGLRTVERIVRIHFFELGSDYLYPSTSTPATFYCAPFLH